VKVSNHRNQNCELRNHRKVSVEAAVEQSSLSIADLRFPICSMSHLPGNLLDAGTSFVPAVPAFLHGGIFPTTW
jgi:hypothetical protein